MKLTATKVVTKLVLKGWNPLQIDNSLVKDVINVVDEHLRKQKGLTIK